MGQQFNLRAMTITSTGTGPLTLGTAVAPFKALNAAPAVPTGTYLSYRIDHGSDWELSEGFYNAAAGTLGRQLVESSTGSLLNITGSAKVAIVPHARDFAPTSNYSATSAPSSANDQSQGYVVGSEWLWAAQRRRWVCVDASTGAAIWDEVTAQGQYLDIRKPNGPATWGGFTHFFEGWQLNDPRFGSYTDGGAGFYNETADNLDGQIGVNRVRFGTNTSLQRAIINLNSNIRCASTFGPVYSFATRIRLRPSAASGAPSATNDYWVSVGFKDVNSERSPANFVSFDYGWDGSAVVFQARSRNSGGAITTSNVPIPTANTWAIMGVEINGLTATWFIDGVQVATRTLGATPAMQPLILGNQTTATVENGYDLDWMSFWVRGFVG